jgi:hypothetical protein
MAAGISAALSIPTGSAAKPANLTGTCAISLAAVAHPLRFKDFPARPIKPGRPAKPRLDSQQARAFRTMLRQGAVHGPNFAGHYTFVGWGCGTSCLTPAIIDAMTGRVFFDSRLEAVAEDHVGEEPDASEPNYWGARFRLDSRLLIILGAPNEDESREGVAFYEWTGSRLKLLRFVSAREACGHSIDRSQ